MPVDDRCHWAQSALSVAQDEDRQPTLDVRNHVETCESCTAFARELAYLDVALAKGQFAKTPVLAPAFPMRSNRRWEVWSVAATALAAVAIGAVVAGVARVDAVQAQDLGALFHTASPSVTGIEARLVVAERGWNPQIPERLYAGSLAYSAPESLAIDLVDNTDYPTSDWVPNDVRVRFADGDLLATTTTRCPVDAHPNCQRPPSTVAILNQRPFDSGVLIPLALVGPGRSLVWWNGIDVAGVTTLAGRSAIQLTTTVAGADFLRAITDRGDWRELHPTDRATVWLDQETLVPLRVEVFAAQTPERKLWEIRRGYADDSREPIFIVELADLVVGQTRVDIESPAGAQSAGFVDSPAVVPQIAVPPGFVQHRTGHWSLPDGGQVVVASWSDGRGWFMVEATESWIQPHLFGMSVPFVRPIELAPGSLGYLSADSTRVSIHGPGWDAVVSGSAPEELLVTIAASLDLVGLPVPSDWSEAVAAGPPSGILIPDVPGWSVLTISGADRTSVLLTGAGSRRVLLELEPVNQLEPPAGPDVVAVEVRGQLGRFDAATSALSWVENQTLIRLRSQNLSLEELLALADSMEER